MLEAGPTLPQDTAKKKIHHLFYIFVLVTNDVNNFVSLR